MRRLQLFLILFYVTNCFAQSVTETVNFDSPSDQSDHFYGMQGLSQISTNGITGGCLMTPDTNNWGNDNSRYCSKYSGTDSAEFITSISFFYSDTIANPGSFDRPASIWHQPFSDPNHYVIATLSHNHKIELISYFSAGSSNFLSINNNTWLELTLTVRIHGDSVLMGAILTDRGPGGTLPPVPVGNWSDAISDSVFARDNAIEVSITGSKSGGAAYLDEFSFHGIKSADSCLSTKIESLQEEIIRMLNYNSGLLFSGMKMENQKFVIYDLSGKIIFSGTVNRERNYIDLSEFQTGCYFLQLPGKSKSFKFILTK